MVYTAALVKYFNNLIAVFVLITFGTTFVALESHGSSLCSASEISHQLHSADSSDSSLKVSPKTDIAKKSQSQNSESNSNKACHCSHSSNCAVTFADKDTKEALFVIIVSHFLTQDEVYSVVLDGLIKPPRA